MSVFQAAFIALFYFFSRSAFNAGLGKSILCQPLVAGTIVGLLLGDPVSGAQLGGIINLGTLALSDLHISPYADPALIGYVGVSLMLLAGVRAGMESAATLFTALMALGILINFMRGMLNSMLAHWADFFAERGDTALVSFMNIAPTQMWLFIITFVPAFFLLRVDIKTLVDLMAVIPHWVQSALLLTQNLLAALGIAISLRLIMQGSSIAYFFLGWMFAFGGNFVPVTLVGACIAVIHAFLARKRMESNQETLITDAQPSDQTPRSNAIAPRLSANDLHLSLLLWVFFHDAGLNFERFQNMGFATALSPVVNRLYSDAKDRAACLQRHLNLFISEFATGALLLGATAALEERLAGGDAISNAEVVGAKTGLMMGVQSVGAVFVSGGITYLGIAIGAALAAQQSLLGPLLFVVIQTAAVLGIAYASFQLGYKRFMRVQAWALANDWLRAGLFGALRLGTFMLGALVVTLVPIQLPGAAAIVIGNVSIGLQARLLDTIMPGILPLAITLLLWWRLRYRNTSPMALLGGILVFSVAASGLLSLLGWL